MGPTSKGRVGRIRRGRGLNIRGRGKGRGSYFYGDEREGGKAGERGRKVREREFRQSEGE